MSAEYRRLTTCFLFFVCIISSFPRKYNNNPVTMRLQTGYNFWGFGYILLFFSLCNAAGERPRAESRPKLLLPRACHRRLLSPRTLFPFKPVLLCSLCPESLFETQSFCFRRKAIKVLWKERRGSGGERITFLQERFPLSP